MDITSQFTKWMHAFSRWLTNTPHALIKLLYGLFYVFLALLLVQYAFAQVSIWNIEQSTNTLSIQIPQFATPQSETKQALTLLETNLHDVQQYLAIPTALPFGVETNNEETTAEKPFSYKDLFNVLIAGKHGSLTDTMILASINEAREEVTLVSFPRDLYWGGQKLNSYYSRYGMAGLKSQLEQISGLVIHKYALIDMYVFIEIVDIMNGLEICLDRPLTDKTYKTYDNGQWGYLHFDAGCQHVNGKQALRLARSRYSDSDFYRSARQQLIIKAVQEKALKMGFGDIGKLTAMGQSMIKRVETDVTFQEGLQYYLKYHKYTIKGNNVLSTSNALFSTRSSDNQYILLPRDGQWYRIKKFVREKINA